MSDQLEQKIVELGANKAPRITPAHIEDTIAEVVYINVASAIKAKGGEVADNSPLNLLTLCVLILKNGFTVTGESACASPENFNEEIGRKVAYDNAVEKVWAFEGYLLKQKLFEDK